VDKKREKEAVDRLTPVVSRDEPLLSPALSQESSKSSNSSLAKLRFVDPADEQDLFPLPSPRRTPTGSPIPSPIASSSCLALSSSTALYTAVTEKLEKKGVVSSSSRSKASPALPPLPATLPCIPGTPPMSIPRTSYPFPQSTSHCIEEEDEDKHVILNSPSSSPQASSSLPHRSTSPSATRPGRRRPSFPAAAASVVRAGVGVLKGISMTSSGQTYPGSGVGVFV